MKSLPGWGVCVSRAVLQPRPPRSGSADPLVCLSLSVLTPAQHPGGSEPGAGCAKLLAAISKAPNSIRHLQGKVLPSPGVQQTP